MRKSALARSAFAASRPRCRDPRLRLGTFVKTMKRRVVVTGVGAVTSLSNEVDDLWNRLIAGQSGIHPITAFDPADYKVKFGGQVQDWAPDSYIDAREQKRIDRWMAEDQ